MANREQLDAHRGGRGIVRERGPYRPRTGSPIDIERDDSLIGHSGRSRHANLDVVDNSTSSLFERELEESTKNNLFDITDSSTWNVESLRNSAVDELSQGANRTAREMAKTAVFGGYSGDPQERDYRFSDVALDQSYTAQSQIQESINKLRQPNQNLLDRFNYDPNWRGFEPVY